MRRRYSMIFSNGRPWRDEGGGQVVHFPIAPVTDDEALLLVEHAEAVRHVGERRLEPPVLGQCLLGHLLGAPGVVQNPPFGRLLLPRAPVPSRRRNPESERGQEAERRGGRDEHAVKLIAPWRLVDIGSDRSDRAPVDDDGDERMSEERRGAGGAFPDGQDRLARADDPEGVAARPGPVHEHEAGFRGELQVPLTVVDLEAEETSRPVRPIEERQAFDRRPLAGCDPPEVRNAREPAGEPSPARPSSCCDAAGSRWRPSRRPRCSRSPARMQRSAPRSRVESGCWRPIASPPIGPASSWLSCALIRRVRPTLLSKGLSPAFDATLLRIWGPFCYNSARRTARPQALPCAKARLSRCRGRRCETA